MNGYVHTVNHYVSHPSIHVFLVDVNHSQSTNKKAVSAWVSVKYSYNEVCCAVRTANAWLGKL